MKRVRGCLADDRYYETQHAHEQMAARRITRPEVWHVLETGRHEARKDQFSQEFNTWKYAIRGKTVDRDRELRIVITFESDDMLVITAIDIS